MITTIRLVNTFIISHKYYIFETFKFYSFSNLQVYNTVSLTIVIMMYTRFSEFIQITTGTL